MGNLALEQVADDADLQVLLLGFVRLALVRALLARPASRAKKGSVCAQSPALCGAHLGEA
eukprot:694020-Prymnesium_polylepis.1